MLKRKRSNVIDTLKTTTNKKVKKLPTSPPLSDFPTDVLKWMKENANPKRALKLMQICKYFQHQEFPYFVVQKLTVHYHKGGPAWKYTKIGSNIEKTDFDNISNKFWITEFLCFDFKRSILIQTMFTKIAVCDIKTLNLRNQNHLSFENFKILSAAGNIESLILRNTQIKNENGEAVPLENLLECCPKLTDLKMSSKSNSFVSYQKATQCVSRYLQYFKLTNVTENFNFEECFKFIQNNQKISFNFCRFYCSDKLKKRLQILTDNLIQAWSPANRPPRISFNGQSKESKDELKKLLEINH